MTSFNIHDLNFKPKDIVIYHEYDNEIWLCYIKKELSFRYETYNRYFINSQEQLLSVNIKNDIYFDSSIALYGKIVRENVSFEEFNIFVNDYISNLIFK